MAAERQPRATRARLAGFGPQAGALEAALSADSPPFAAGFSYISILTGVIRAVRVRLPAQGRPGGLVVVAGRADRADARSRCASRSSPGNTCSPDRCTTEGRTASTGDFASRMTGWIYIVGSIVTVAAVAVAWQVMLAAGIDVVRVPSAPRRTRGSTTRRAARKNALLLGAILVIIATIVNMLGVKVMAFINNFGVLAELIGASLLAILLLFHITRGSRWSCWPRARQGAGHPWGHFGAFIMGGISSAYVMYGFDHGGHAWARRPTTRAGLHQRRSSGRSRRPRLLGGLLLIISLMDVKNINGQRTSAHWALPASPSRRFGDTTSGRSSSSTQRSQSPSARSQSRRRASELLFAMARDGRLPFRQRHIAARLQAARKVPIVPALVTGILIAGPRSPSTWPTRAAFLALTGVADHHVLPRIPRHPQPRLLAKRLRSRHVADGPIKARMPCSRPLGRRWSTGPRSSTASVVAVDIAWPRSWRSTTSPATAGHGHWYWQPPDAVHRRDDRDRRDLLLLGLLSQADRGHRGAPRRRAVRARDARPHGRGQGAVTV